MLDPGGKGLGFFIGNLGVILAQTFQDEVRYVFNIMLPFLFAPHVVDFPRLEVIDNIGEGAAGILNIVEDAFVLQVDSIGFISRRLIEEALAAQKKPYPGYMSSADQCEG